MLQVASSGSVFSFEFVLEIYKLEGAVFDLITNPILAPAMQDELGLF